jgi:hypothetical protein
LFVFLMVAILSRSHLSHSKKTKFFHTHKSHDIILVGTAQKWREQV